LGTEDVEAPGRGDKAWIPLVETNRFLVRCRGNIFCGYIHQTLVTSVMKIKFTVKEIFECLDPDHTGLVMKK